MKPLPIPMPRWRAAAARIHTALALITLIVAMAPASAAEPCCQRGLLFRIEPADAAAAPSWLFGTLHSDDPRVTDLPAAVRRRFDASDAVVLELVPDARSARASAEAMMLAPGRRLSELLPAELFRRTRAALGRHGVPARSAERLKPWAAVVMLSVPRARSGAVLDVVLYRRALAGGKPVQGLETVDEQFAAFDALSLDEQITLLEDTLAARERFSALFAALIGAYLARDLAGLHRLGERLLAADEALDAALREALIGRRNERMLERLRAMLAEGGRFVAVGALHLPGEEGLLARLDALGYRVDRVY
jgi:uncharacterized protein YbaP (TraB family)